MLEFDFKNQIERLKGCFGQNNFTAERVALIWKTVEPLRHDQFSAIVDHFISNSRTAPLPADFIKAYYEEQRRMNAAKSWIGDPEPVEIDCHDCYMTGWMFIKIKESAPTVILHCHCHYGANLEENRGSTFIPRWNRDCAPIYGWIKLQFPFKAFVPNTEERKKLLSTGFSEIVDRWNQKVKESEKFWRKLSESINSGEGA